MLACQQYINLQMAIYLLFVFLGMLMFFAGYIQGHTRGQEAGYLKGRQTASKLLAKARSHE